MYRREADRLVRRQFAKCAAFRQARGVRAATSLIAQLDPRDWKPMNSVVTGVREIRIHQDGEFRVFYVAKFPEAIYVLSAFEKKSRQTSQNEIRLAADRLRSVMEERRRRRR